MDKLEALTTATLFAAAALFAAVPARAEVSVPQIDPIAAPDAVAAGLITKLEQAGPLLIGDREFDREGLPDLYRLTGYDLFWIAGDVASDAAGVLIDFLHRADAEGLRRADYAPQLLTQLFAALDAEEPATLVRADVALTAAALRYADDVAYGRIDPSRYRTEDQDIDIDWGSLDRLAAGVELVQSEDPVAVLEELRPSAEAYDALLTALSDTRALQAAGGWPIVPAGPTLRPGDRSDRIPAMRERLAAGGEYRPFPEMPDGFSVAESALGLDEDHDADLYDARLAAAVETFQGRHNLVVDGIVGPATLAALNRGMEERESAIIGTLERLRWTPTTDEATRINVNLAAQQLRLYEDGDLVRDMRVVVGRPDRPTPIFSSALTWLEWNPTWTMPTSIAVRDYRAKLQEDPTYLSSNGYTLYSDWSAQRIPLDPTQIEWDDVTDFEMQSMMIRQSPGANNALGKVKFMMANSFSVYLHDTNARHLFSRDRRVYSSGCVRVHDPMWLAEHLLEGNASWAARRDQVLNGWDTTRIILDNAMPLHLVYETAEVDGDGTLLVYEDVYGLDAKLDTFLNLERGVPAYLAQVN